MYTGQQRWHLTLPGSNHEQSGGCQEGAIDTTKGGAGYKQGHDPGHLAIQPDDDMSETMMIMMVMMYLSEKVTATASDPRTSDTDKVV